MAVRRTRTPRTNAEWSARTQSTILRTARAMFASHGYDGCSLEIIAAAAGMTKGAIYHHFRDKRQLFHDVYEDAQRAIVAEVERSARRVGRPFEGVQRGCEAFLDAASTPELARIVLVDAPRVLGWSAWRAVDTAIGAPSLRAGLEAAMDAGEMVRLDSNALATLVSGALNEAALTIVESTSPARTRRAVIRSLRRLLDGLRTDVTVRSRH